MSTYIKWIRKKFSKSLYVQIWSNRLRIAVVGSNEIFDDKPLVAIEVSPRGAKIVKGIGNKTEVLIGPNIETVNPFLHPRTLFANFLVGQKLLQHAFLYCIKGHTSKLLQL